MLQLVTRVFESLANDHSLDLFKTIAHESVSSVMLRNKVKLTRKQYYSRLARMIGAGLIKRKNGKLVLTAFGKIVYEAQKTIDSAANNHWKLKVIDSIELSDELPKEERKKLLDNLIENKQIREILSEESIDHKNVHTNIIPLKL